MASGLFIKKLQVREEELDREVRRQLVNAPEGTYEMPAEIERELDEIAFQLDLANAGVPNYQIAEELATYRQSR